MDRFTLIASGYLLLIKDNNILLARRCNTGYEDGKYSVPAGHLEAHETIRQCCAREVKEEINLDIDPHELDLVHVMHRKQEDERIDYFFVPKHWHGEIINNEPEKCDDLQWFPLDKLPKNIIPYIKTAIKHAQNKVIYSEFGWNV